MDIGNMHSGKITVEGVTENQHIKAEFAKYSDDYSWNLNEALKVQDGKYLFDKAVVFTAKEQWADIFLCASPINQRRNPMFPTIGSSFALPWKQLTIAMM